MGEDATTPPASLDPAGGPAWPPDRWISPTALNQHCTCPRQVRFKHIDRLPEPWSFNVHLIKGRVAHEILRQSACLVAKQKPVLSDEMLNKMVSQRFRPRDFPSNETMESHIADVLRWIRYGLGYLDRDAGYVVIERNVIRPVALPVLPGPYTLMARPDLILLRTDRDGERYVEFIDYKTGKPRDDEVVPVFTRYVSRELLKRHLPNPTTTRMQFTFLWLDARERQVIDLSLDYCEWNWESVKGQIGWLLNEREWPERPSHLCKYCAYSGNACSAYARMALAGTTITSI